MAIDLGKQIGPLPLGAWIVVVGAGLGIMLWTRGQSTGEGEPQEDIGAPPGVGEGPGTPGWIDFDPPPSGDTDNEIVDNTSWLRAATDFCIGMGFPADVVVRALNRGIDGEQLTAQEAAIWRLALVRYGMPPDGVMPGPPTPPIPGPNPGPNPSPNNPPVVLGLFVSSTGRRSAVLRWAGLRNWWNYRIYRMNNGRKSLAAPVTASSGNVPIVSYELKNLQPGTRYTDYFVVAVNAAGKEGPPSNKVSFTTKK